MTNKYSDEELRGGLRRLLDVAVAGGRMQTDAVIRVLSTPVSPDVGFNIIHVEPASFNPVRPELAAILKRDKHEPR